MIFADEVGFEQWPLAHSDSGRGHQLRCVVLSMEFRMKCLQKDMHGQVLGFSPL